MTARRPESVTLRGRFVTLEPMIDAHVPELWRALGHPAVFAGGYGGGPAGLPVDEAAYARWNASYYAGDARQNFVVRIASGPHLGAVIGATTLGDFDEAAGSTHIGWTAYDPRVWGTQADGSWRDTAIYSILSSEWPTLRRGLETRLAGFGERPVLFRSAPTAPTALPGEQRAGA